MHDFITLSIRVPTSVLLSGISVSPLLLKGRCSARCWCLCVCVCQSPLHPHTQTHTLTIHSRSLTHDSFSHPSSIQLFIHLFSLIFIHSLILFSCFVIYASKCLFTHRFFFLFGLAHIKSIYSFKWIHPVIQLWTLNCPCIINVHWYS